MSDDNDLCWNCFFLKTMIATPDNIKDKSFFDSHTLNKKLSETGATRVWWCSKNMGNTKEVYITKQKVMELKRPDCEGRDV